nr:putative uncharacterized protein DDB_G0286901 isoform X2 [Dermatophagoides pteronyssinus]
MTTQPSNESELQLYRVLQRANLLSYYDTFICQGGDDVQQLYEAGEDEFLEIMALVGMAAKPLHVRRLQKSLHEWATNPALFQSPLMPSFHSNNNQSTNSSSSSSLTGQLTSNVDSVSTTPTTTTTAATSSTSTTSMAISTRTILGGGHQSSSTAITAQSTSPSATALHRQQNSNSPANVSFHTRSAAGNQSKTPSPSQFQPNNNVEQYSQPCSPITMTPILTERQIQRLADAAEQLVKNLPASILDLKPTIGNNNNGNKKRIVKEIENIMTMLENDPHRMNEIRRYAAIYGRFDCKRKPEKPLTLHEVSVNEAAAQICNKIPQLLYRRDELFPLARQVVRDSGYQYSKGHSRSQSCRIGGSGGAGGEDSNTSINNESTTTTTKRIRLVDNHNHNNSRSSPLLNQSLNNGDSGKNSSIGGGGGGNHHQKDDRKRRHNRLEGIVDQLKSLSNEQEQIQNQINEANEQENFHELNQLQNELNLINDHQMKLVNEKSQLEQQQQQQPKQQQDHQKNSLKKSLSSDQTETMMMMMIEREGQGEHKTIETDDTDDSQYSLYSNESTIPTTSSSSLLQEQQQQQNSHHSSLSNDNVGGGGASVSNEATTIMTGPTGKSGKKKTANGLHQQSSTPKTTLSSSNDDSIDYGKHLNDVIDEGLRLMENVIIDENNIDLRLFNKYTEVLRNNNNATITGNGQSSDIINNNYNNNYRSPKADTSSTTVHHRQRGRPPKNNQSLMNTSNTTTATISSNERLDNTFYEQLLTQAQIQQQMQQLYQQSFYAQAFFGDFNNSAITSPSSIDTVANLPSSSSSTFQIDHCKTIDHNDDDDKNIDRMEIVQSLNALMSISSNGNNDNDGGGGHHHNHNHHRQTSSVTIDGATESTQSNSSSPSTTTTTTSVEFKMS